MSTLKHDVILNDNLSVYGERRRSAAECQTMGHVREEVDRLDRILVRFLAERQTYMEAAARIKPRRDDVRDPARIEDVVGKVLETADKEGLSRAIAEPVWRELIERSIAHEYEAFDGLNRS